VIINCASNDEDICLYDNLRMFHNLAESGIPMITFCTGREIEDRSYKNGEYVFSKYLIKELALNKYSHITVLQLWGCFGSYERDIRFFRSSFLRMKQGSPILIPENKLFSYIYVDDLVNIIREIVIHGIKKDYWRIVAYTESLANYALLLGGDINVVCENMLHSYVGKNDYEYNYTPLKQAIEEYYKWFNRQ
jgi:nucleoside-diphosphate-sugar epimerase